MYTKPGQRDSHLDSTGHGLHSVKIIKLLRAYKSNQHIWAYNNPNKTHHTCFSSWCLSVRTQSIPKPIFFCLLTDGTTQTNPHL